MIGKIVQWTAQPSSIRTAIVANVPAVRNVGRVFAIKGDFASITPSDAFDPHSRVIVPVANLTVLGDSRAGWALPVAQGGFV